MTNYSPDWEDFMKIIKNDNVENVDINIFYQLLIECLKYGTAHFNILIYGFRFLPTCSKIRILVKRVANSPYKLIPYYLIISSIPFNKANPCKSLSLIWVNLVKSYNKVL